MDFISKPTISWAAMTDTSSASTAIPSGINKVFRIESIRIESNWFNSNRIELNLALQRVKKEKKAAKMMDDSAAGQSFVRAEESCELWPLSISITSKDRFGWSYS